MAESLIVGTGGNVALPAGFAAKLSTWAANAQIGRLDTTGFGDGGYRTGEPTLVSIAGSAAGVLKQGAAGDTPLPAGFLGASTTPASAMGTITLTAATGCTWAFTATISNVAIVRKEDGGGEVTFDFESTGVITQAWVVS